MNHFARYWLLVAAVAIALAGCGREPAKPQGTASAGKDLPSFKDGKGLLLPEETRRSIGLEIADVSEQKVVPQFTTQVQVYEAGPQGTCASGLVTAEQAKSLRAGQPVSLATKGGKIGEGKVRAVNDRTQLVPGEAEVIVEVPRSEAGVVVGATLSARFSSGSEETATVVPRTAVLRAAQGDFVYVVNGERLLRTAVGLGLETDGLVQIRDGLYAGDKIAVKPVEILWLTELRLARAGGD